MLVFIVSLAVAVLSALASSEILIRRHVLPEDPFDAARAMFHSPGPDIAAFGDSRMNDGILRTTGIANYAMPGDSLTTVLGKVEAWFARNPDGQAIVGIPPQQFSLARLNADQDRVLEDFLSESDAWIHSLRPNYRRYLLSYVKTILKDPALLVRPRPASGQPGTTAASFADLASDERRAQAQIRSQHHTPVPGFRNRAVTRDLHTRLAELIRRGARLCLVTMPVSTAYQQAVAPEPAFADARALVAGLAQDLGMPHIDLWSEYPDRLFANADHLNTRGAARATRDVLEACFGTSDRPDPGAAEKP